MILFLALGCFAGAAAASGYVILDFNGGYYDGADIQPGLTHGTNKIEEYYTKQSMHLTIKIYEAAGSDYLVYNNSKEEVILNKTYLKSSASEGYYRTFAGWSVSKDGSDDILFDEYGKLYTQIDYDNLPQESKNAVRYDESEDGILKWNSTTLGTGNITLYAVWSEPQSNENYVFLDANGGSFGGNPSESSDYGQRTATRIGYGITSTENTFIQFEGNPYVEPMLGGHIFKGWSATSDGKNIVSDGTFEPFDDDSVYGDLKLTHGFSGNDQFKVKKVGSGYQWVALVDSSDIYYDSPNVETLYVTLYAVWEKIEEPTGGSSAIILIGSKSSSSGSGPHIEHKYVTFDANGGLGEMEKQQFTGGQTKALSANQFTFAGKNFAGWALEPTGMVTYSDGQEIMVEEDITLYAVWVEPIPENPDVGEGEDETGIPTWLAVLLVAVVLAILIAVLVYFLVIRRGAA